MSLTHKTLWLSVLDTPPPTGVRLLVAYDPEHLVPAINLAKLESGHGWYADGQRVPAPSFWMPVPTNPFLRESSSSTAVDLSSRAVPPAARDFF